MLAASSVVPSLEAARTQTDALFHLVNAPVLYERPVAERHRLIFYLGHLEAFDWNLIRQALPEVRSFDPELDHLFAFGIDPPPGRLPDDPPSAWPAIEQVERYNRRIRERLDRVLSQAPEQMIHVALEHRLMHAETFSYLLHNLPAEKKIAPRLSLPAARPAPAEKAIEIPAGLAVLGKRRSSGFGWDNEFEENVLEVPGFSIDKFKVTNGQYLEFVAAGGEAPHFWKRKGNDWLLRTMFAEIPLPPSWPVYANYEQASQYAAWAGKSLPSEAQFHRAAYGIPGRDDQRPYPWGEAVPHADRGNFASSGWDPVSVDATPLGDSAFGVSQLVGNGWEWTSTAFHPFPGFERFPFYPGYSADFFDGAHYVLKGGSPRTATPLLRRSFRNWFRPNYAYAYAGFRCVEN